MRLDAGTSAATGNASDATPLTPLARFGIGLFCGCTLLIWLPWCLGVSGGVSLAWWFDVGHWTITRVLRLPEHFSSSPSSTDNLTQYVSLAVFLVTSSLLAAIWLVLDRPGLTHRLAFSWAFLATRLMLASFMMGYGWVKVLPAQFGLMANGAGTDYLIQQVGQLGPRDMLWAFMEASRSYQVAAGLVELCGGLLLLTRTTTMWGAFISAAAMSNVVMLDIGYDVGVKFLAGLILSLALSVSVPYIKGLGSLLVGHAAARTPQTPVFGRHRIQAAIQIAGVLTACVLVWWTFRSAANVMQEFAQSPAQTPLHGIWDVEQVSRAGESVPMLITDQGMWRRLVLPWQGTDGGAILVWMSDAVTYCSSKIDTKAQTLTIEPDSDPAATRVGSARPTAKIPARLFFHYAVEAGDALVLTSADRDGPSVSIRLRRFDHSQYRTIAHKRGWRW